MRYLAGGIIYFYKQGIMPDHYIAARAINKLRIKRMFIHQYDNNKSHHNRIVIIRKDISG